MKDRALVRLDSVKGDSYCRMVRSNCCLNVCFFNFVLADVANKPNIESPLDKRFILFPCEELATWVPDSPDVD